MTTEFSPLPLVNAPGPDQGVSIGRPAGKVVIHTHGCKLNQADSSVLARQFRQAGYHVVEDVREADIYVLNTCTVTATADSKARQSLRAASRANPDAVVVAAGCYPQRAAEELARLPAVSLVVGNDEKHRVASLAIAAHGERKGVEPGETNLSSFAVSGQDVSGNLPGRTRAMVKIQEGCDQVCAYCIVPKVRGRELSIPPDEIIRQVNRRVSEGCLEVALTGTQLGTYGFDLAGDNLVSLIQRILSETEVLRLRVSSLQPQEIDENLLQLWLDDTRLCPHFHVPLQCGSDAILRAMRRRYTTEQFASTVASIRQAMPDAGITADLIVGFPGEGEREFSEGLGFVAEMAFSDMHVFPYSQRPGTSAIYLNGHVSPAEKKERVARALQQARASFEHFRLSQVGMVRDVLWEGSKSNREEKRMTGLTENYVRVQLDTGDYGESPIDLPNTTSPCRLGILSGNYVLAVPVGPGGPVSLL